MATGPYQQQVERAFSSASHIWLCVSPCRLRLAWRTKNTGNDSNRVRVAGAPLTPEPSRQPAGGAGSCGWTGSADGAGEEAATGATWLIWMVPAPGATGAASRVLAGTSSVAGSGAWARATPPPRSMAAIAWT